jgi:hypothetical protein
MDKVLTDILAMYISDKVSPGEWDTAGLINTIRLKFGWGSQYL